jgi:hypothetical protein
MLKSGQIVHLCMFFNIAQQNQTFQHGWVFKIFFFFVKKKKQKILIFTGSPHGNELYYVFGVPFFNDSQVIPWYGYRLNSQYFRVQDQELSNYTMHLIANFARWSNPTPFGFFNDNPSVLNQVNLNNLYSNLPFSTTADTYTRNLNITWQPMQPSNMTYLVISSQPEVKSNYKFDESGFWNYYWPKLWERRLTVTPIPLLKNALLSYQDSYILFWVFLTVSILLVIILIFTCFIVCKKIRKEKYDEDEL